MKCVDRRETTPNRPEEETDCEGYTSLSSVECECVEFSKRTRFLNPTREPTEQETYRVPRCLPFESQQLRIQILLSVLKNVLLMVL